MLIKYLSPQELKAVQHDPPAHLSDKMTNKKWTSFTIYQEEIEFVDDLKFLHSKSTKVFVFSAYSGIHGIQL